MKHLWGLTCFMALLLLLLPVTVMASGKTEAGSEKAEEMKKLEIMSWWTTGGEVLGLEAMFDVYKKLHPSVEIVNAAVAGSRGSNARAVLVTRMQGGNPPDSFQVLAGKALIETWVKPGMLEPVTFLFKENDWFKVFPKGMLDLVSYQGEVYAVPVNIHRTNVLWYSKPIFDKLKLKPPQSLDEFFSTAEIIKKAGITPLAFGTNKIWGAMHLLESVFVAAMGPDKYRGLFTGSTKWDDPGTVAALETYTRMLEYTNKDHPALTGADQAQYVVDGKCAMTIMGDWIAGYYNAKKYTPHVDFEWDVAPGTAGSYLMNSDTFVLPKGPIKRRAAIEWLKVVGSRDGQDAFNPLKGSIPVRTDAKLDIYSEYHQGAIADFKKSEILPSFAHGTALSDSWFQDIGDVMSVFIVDRNVQYAAKKLQEIASEYVK
ncbi:MAG TPA: ABC transporter substrate-binding protein [Spirochaetia bacterium]|nr:ABC transporter substrate-binding protein [Spirochaetia bacterium]